MDAVIRTLRFPVGVVTLPDARAVLPPTITAGVAEHLREVHAESAIASAVEGLGLGTIAETAAEADAEIAREREAARREAAERGYAEGHAAAAAKVSEEWASRIEEFDQLLDTVADERNDLLPKLEDDLVTIAYGAIVHIVGEGSVAPAVVREAVRKASLQHGAEVPITVRVSPGQFELMRSAGGLTPSVKRKIPIEVVEDPRVVLGGCIIETGRGTLDARLETQLQRLKAALLNVRAQE